MFCTARPAEWPIHGMVGCILILGAWRSASAPPVNPLVNETIGTNQPPDGDAPRVHLSGPPGSQNSGPRTGRATGPYGHALPDGSAVARSFDSCGIADGVTEYTHTTLGTRDPFQGNRFKFHPK